MKRVIRIFFTKSRLACSLVKFLIGILVLFSINLNGQSCFPPPPPETDDGDFDCASDGVMPACSFGIANPPVPGGLYCDPADEELYNVRLYLHILRKESDLSGARDIGEIKNAIERLQRNFSTLGIIFSIEGIQYLDVSDAVYDYSNADFETVTSLQTHSDGIDVYFIGLGIYNNGKATSIAKSTVGNACVIGGGVSNEGFNLLNETTILEHEIGHCLGLLHTSEILCDGSDCDSQPSLPCDCGDHVFDTPLDFYENALLSYCIDNETCERIADISGLPQCSDANSWPISNIMSLYPAHCRTKFTEGQKRRMKRYLSTCPKLNPVVSAGPIRVGSGMEWSIGPGGIDLIGFCLPGFIIEPGATLNLASDLEFSTNAKIIVKATGRLNVNGVKLTSCDSYWQGIEVYSNFFLPQSITNQGMVRLYSGSTIQLAEKPLNVWAPAIVLATGTVFDHCGTSTFTNTYNTTFASYNHFTDCEFLNTTATPFQFWGNVKLTNIRGLVFNNCTFTTAPGMGASLAAPFAIDAYNARFGVSSGSEFTNYRRAIIAGADNGVDRSFTVKNSTFTNNYNSIENWNVDGCTIRGNSITGIGSSIWPPNRPSTGIVLRNCTRYEVTDNNLTGASNTGNNIGIWAYDTGSDGNILRRNTFTNMKTSNAAQLNNRGQDADEGLQYWCNTNINCTNDFVVSGSICQEQGLENGAKNKFSQVNTTNGDYLNSGGSLINYYYIDALLEVPQYTSNITSIEKSLSVDCTGSTGEEDEEGDGKLTNQGEQTFITKFNDAKTEYQTKRAQYDALLSGSPAALALIPDLAKQRSIMHRSADRILRSEFSDPENLDWTKIRTWLHNKDSKESEYAIVESWILEGNTGNAEQVFDAIPSTFNLTGDALAQHDSYEDWMDLRISFKTQQKDVYNLGASDVLLIQNIADNGTGFAAAQTQSLLNHQYGYNYMISFGGFGGQPIFGPSGNNSVAHPENLFAFPNPAKEDVNFRYRLREGVEESLLTIHDLEGRLVASIALQGSSGIVLWETKGLSSGVFYYKAEDIEGFAVPQKLVLIK